MPIQFSDNSTVMMPLPIFSVVVEAAGGGIDDVDLTGGIRIVDAGDFDGSDAVQNSDFLYWVHIDVVGAGIGDGHQWRTWSVSAKTFQAKLYSNRLQPIKQRGRFGLSTITCSPSNGKEPDSVNIGVKSVERLLEEKRRAKLSAGIASGEFIVEKSGFPSQLKSGLSKVGVPRGILDFLFSWADAPEDYKKKKFLEAK
ncbi:hypothetical protein ACFX1T_034029 [Malus domestica]